MTLNVHQSWLADRGITSSGSQPFQLLASSIDPLGTTLLIASATALDASTVVVAVSRLAAALSNIELGAQSTNREARISWLVANESLPMPTINLIKTLCPCIVRCIDLTRTGSIAFDVSKPVQISASRVAGIDSIFGPKMAQMNADAALKKSFWISLQQWMSHSHSAKFSREV